jgi:hypothetical protein
LKPVEFSPASEISTHSDAPEDILAADEAREAEHSKPAMAAQEATADSLPKTTPQPAAVDTETNIPVADVERAKAASEPIATAPESAAALTDSALEATQPPTIVPEEQTTLAEPLVIELVSDPPGEEFGDGAAEEMQAARHRAVRGDRASEG